MTTWAFLIQGIDYGFAAAVKPGPFQVHLKHPLGKARYRVVFRAFEHSSRLRNVREVTWGIAEAGGKSYLISMSPDFFAASEKRLPSVNPCLIPICSAA